MDIRTYSFFKFTNKKYSDLLSPHVNEYSQFITTQRYLDQTPPDRTQRIKNWPTARYKENLILYPSLATLTQLHKDFNHHEFQPYAPFSLSFSWDNWDQNDPVRPPPPLILYTRRKELVVVMLNTSSSLLNHKA